MSDSTPRPRVVQGHRDIGSLPIRGVRGFNGARHRVQTSSSEALFLFAYGGIESSAFCGGRTKRGLVCGLDAKEGSSTYPWCWKSYMGILLVVVTTRQVASCSVVDDSLAGTPIQQEGAVSYSTEDAGDCRRTKWYDGVFAISRVTSVVTEKWLRFL